jgi:hypothetical protein
VGERPLEQSRLRRAFVVCLSATSVKMTAMDYEYQPHQPANHHPFRCVDLVAAPEAFPPDRLLAQGARPGRTWRYPGLKEHIALAGFRPDPGYPARAGSDASRPVIVVRPPADLVVSTGGSMNREAAAHQRRPRGAVRRPTHGGGAALRVALAHPRRTSPPSQRQPSAPCFTCRAPLPCKGVCTATLNQDHAAWNGRRFDTMIRACHKGG